MRVNIVAVFNKDASKALFCLRSKDPYKGMYNFVGGKVDRDESDIMAAYRELSEETGITDGDINLTHFMNIYYAMSDTELIVYVGKLNKDVTLVEEKNKLFWIDINENFFDLKKFAGEGNVGHIIENIKYYKDTLLV